jgi:hypothetical protein
MPTQAWNEGAAAAIGHFSLEVRWRQGSGTAPFQCIWCRTHELLLTITMQCVQGSHMLRLAVVCSVVSASHGVTCKHVDERAHHLPYPKPG